MGTVPWISAPAMRLLSSSRLALKQIGHVVGAACCLVALHQVRDRRASVAGDADGGANDSEADGFLGEEDECRAPGFGGADGDEEGDHDLLGVFESGAEADDCLATHVVSPSVVRCWFEGTDERTWRRPGFPLQIERLEGAEQPLL
jgi:hypothetical protein